MNHPPEPAKPLPVAKASEKPTAQNIRNEMARLMTIFPATAPAFFMRERPISSIAKPACMNSTRIAATTTHIWFVAKATSLTVVSAAKAAVGDASSASNAMKAKRRIQRDRMFSPSS